MPGVTRWFGGLSVVLVLVLGGCTGSRELPPLELAPILGGRAFEQPVEVAPYPAGRLFVAERRGVVWLVDEAEPEGRVLLDIDARTDSEFGEGLLSVALDPRFEENGALWVYYFLDANPDRTLLSRFTVSDDVADAGSELVVIEFEQPGFNQNGGSIRFGSDGLLYLSLGDGSASTDPFENGQNLGTLLGSVIRIDVREATAEEPYRVPEDNPFLEVEGARPEIYAYGLRNPYRMAFDPKTDELWLGDVGVSAQEEVNRVEAGDNLGWNVVEGTACLSRATECDQSEFAAPVVTYPHGERRCAVIGGVVYRGPVIDALEGRYVYGDFCSGRVWAVDREGETEPVELAVLDDQLSSFAADEDGEVLVLGYSKGLVYRLSAIEE